MARAKTRGVRVRARQIAEPGRTTVEKIMECTFAGVNQFIGQVLLADSITLQAVVNAGWAIPDHASSLKNEGASAGAGRPLAP